jgi:hypothetical protein
VKKFKAIILWPYVFFLDWLISLTGAQTFEESRRITRAHFNRIMNGSSEPADIFSNTTEPGLPKPLDATKKTYFSRNSNWGNETL